MYNFAVIKFFIGNSFFIISLEVIKFYRVREAVTLACITV